MNYKNKKVLIPLFLALFVSIILVVLEATQTTNLFQKDTNVSEGAQTTSTEESAQSDFNDGNDRTAGNTVSENEGSASVVDNNGAVSSDKSKPTTSQTGEITLYLPTINQLVKNGQELSGTSSLGVVYYRIIDNVSGVIASGQLQVVNGNFSGNISFDSSATEGRIDIYGTKSDGTEFSNVEIPVRFK